MKRTFLLLAFACTAFAQSAGYVFVAPVVVPKSAFTRWNGTFAHVGIGGEAAIGKHASAGAEAGLMVPATNVYAKNTATGTVGASYHPRGSATKVAPFISAGGGLLAANGVGGIVYFGGGVNYWLRDHLGLRAEYRHYYYPLESGIHFAGFRLGVTFR